jgi:hypothetical protein
LKEDKPIYGGVGGDEAVRSIRRRLGSSLFSILNRHQLLSFSHTVLAELIGHARVMPLCNRESVEKASSNKQRAVAIYLLYTKSTIRRFKIETPR